MIKRGYSQKIILLSLFFLFSLAQNASAISFTDAINFYIEKDFDSQERSQIAGVLVKTSPKLYFYIEKDWWNSQHQEKKREILSSLDELSYEFNDKIYPILTSVFGSEQKPGVDGDEKITLLFIPMNRSEGGYFRTADEYVKLQLPNSNEREMLYLSIDLLEDPKLKVVLAHEFVHLISFNQKDKAFGVEDEVWLNEARADYSSTILGYNDIYFSSNLQSRVRDFIESPSDSITEWKGSKYDYASISVFTHYLVDHYGINILIDSLKSEHSGIKSINYALGKAGYEEEFSEIFTDWTIAVVVNDCSLGLKYCYLNKNLKNLKLSPALNFLPISENVFLSVNNAAKNWAGNWQKFIGGNGNLNLGFSSIAGLNFKVPYALEDKNGRLLIEFLALDSQQKGKISVTGFGADYRSLTIFPSLQTKLSQFDGLEFTYPYGYTVTIKNEDSLDEETLIQQLLDQIEYLKNQITKLQAQVAGGNGGQNSCARLNNNLSFGMSGEGVRCLQEFLKKQGADIYPEALVTGYFGNLTRAAVARFQEKYASEILNPFGLYSGTGYVGPSTRSKINQLIF